MENANGRWPSESLLPAIEPYRKVTAGLLVESSPAPSPDLRGGGSPTSRTRTSAPKGNRKIISPDSATSHSGLANRKSARTATLRKGEIRIVPMAFFVD
eukprot:g63113.t1